MQQKQTLNIDLEKLKNKFAQRLTLLFTVTFAILSIAHYNVSTLNFFTMLLGFFIGLGCFLYNLIYKKNKLVYWIFSITGVVVTGLSLNILHNSVHFGEFIWMFSAIVLAFFGLNKKVAFTLLFFALVAISYFVFFTINTHIELLQSRTPFQKIALFSDVMVGFLCGIYMIYTIFEFYSLSEATNIKNNLELKLQNEKIKSQDEEKSVLIKEVHHRVKNNLQIIISLLRMQSNEIQNLDAQKHFQEAINRIMSMSLIHQKLYKGSSLANVNFNEYFNELISEIIDTYNQNEKVSFEISINEVEFSPEQIVPLGLLVNELTTNSIKHAFINRVNGLISLKMDVLDGVSVLTYKDNGLWKQESIGSFGIDLIDMLSEQLNVSKAFFTSENGTVYNFTWQ